MSFISRNIKNIFLISFILVGFSLSGQNTAGFIKGNINFISSQNVYVQFVNTDGIEIGDSIFILKNDKYQPILIVKNKSSISCIGTVIGTNVLAVSNQVYARKRVESVPIEVAAQKSKEGIALNDQAINSAKAEKKATGNNSSFSGRVSLSGFINNTSDTTLNSTFRFNLSLNAHHIANSNFSAECDLSLTNRNTYRPFVNLSSVDSMKLVNFRQTFNDARIYNLSLKYDISKTASVLFGRKINLNLANIGAIDGLQFENTGKFISFGGIVGSRPDTYTYAINPTLFQFGAYISQQLTNKTGSMQTSVAFFNQTNNMLTDRRFVYIQHSNSLIKNIDFFGSAEVDLFGLQNNQPINTFNLTSAYLSLRWSARHNLSLALSYDARKNIYYYETYKNYVDSLLDKETRQGLKFQINYQPFSRLSWGGTAGYRFATATSDQSLNGYTYLTYSQLPLIDASFTIDATALKTSYMTGVIYEASLSRDFFNGKLFAELSYQKVNYTFKTTSQLLENNAEINLSWRITRKLIFSMDFETMKDTNSNLQGQLFFNITQRF
ncbi:MAG: hypothetical protein P4L34_13750 [Paludibacter sp.]|nr:hypothetical protein [Paludibacter sp.]